MRAIISIIVTAVVIAALMIKKTKKYKWTVLTGYIVAIIALSAFYNNRTMDLILPFYTPTNQMFYQSDFAKEGVYPDSILPHLMKDKIVYMPMVMQWRPFTESFENGECWENGSIQCMNMENIFSSCGAEVNLTGDFSLINEAQKAYFEDLGCFNDALRYSFFYNDLDNKYGNSFYYYWYYGTTKKPFELFVCPKGLDESDELVVLADTNFNMYIISKDYYEQEVSKL